MTRTAMAGPAADGGKVPSDPRLLAELIRRTALTLQPEGWVKAHTCSDRYDIHAKMEDRACNWVEGIRLYHEATGDEDFLAHRTGTGLVSARDWVVWKNPTGYLIGQTTPLNSFIARALSDASALAGIADDPHSRRERDRRGTLQSPLPGTHSDERAVSL